MARPAAAQIISIGRSEHPEWTPQEVLGWHTEHNDWWSSTRHDGGRRSDPATLETLGRLSQG
jgi:hypothetical protein